MVALAMLSWVLTRPGLSPGGGFGYGLVFGVAFYLPLLPWISGLVGPVPWIALSFVQALFPAMFGLFAVLVVRLTAVPGRPESGSRPDSGSRTRSLSLSLAPSLAPLSLALLWSLQEWLKSSIPFGGFPWGVLAFGQTNGPLLVLAQWGGVPLLSFAVALLGTSLWALLEGLLAGRVGGNGPTAGGWFRSGPGGLRRLRSVVVPVATIGLVLVAAAAATPGVRRAALPADDETAVTVAAVQGNVPRLGLDFAAQRRAVLDNHVSETLRLAADVRAGKARQPRFVIWPENSSDIDPLINADAAAEIDAAARAIGVPILVGAVLARPDWTPDNPAASNTVLVWQPGAGPGERHDKQIVQPFGEYLPWRGFFSLLSSYADRAGYFVPGNGSAVVYPDGIPVGVATCWEVIFDRALRESVRNGAQMLAVPTNNATFDAAMSEQHLAFARLRAVEHGRYVVVAGTTGISAGIAPDGRELARTEFFTPAYVDLEVRLRSARTPATGWAQPLQWLLAAAAIAVIGAAILHNGGPMRPTRGRPDEGAG